MTMKLTEGQKEVRKAFRETYGSRTFQVVDRLLRGWDTQRVAERLNLPVGSVRAVAANLTRGTYDAFVN